MIEGLRVLPFRPASAGEWGGLVGSTETERVSAVRTYDDTTDPRVGTTFEVDGWTVSVDTAHDDAIGNLADEYDGFTSAQVDAWKRNEWTYVGCIVRVSREGVELGSASLWGLEHGYFTYTDEHDNVTGHGWVGPYAEAVDDLIAEAIDEAKATLRKLCADWPS